MGYDRSWNSHIQVSTIEIHVDELLKVLSCIIMDTSALSFLVMHNAFKLDFFPLGHTCHFSMLHAVNNNASYDIDSAYMKPRHAWLDCSTFLVAYNLQEFNDIVISHRFLWMTCFQIYNPLTIMWFLVLKCLLLCLLTLGHASIAYEMIQERTYQPWPTRI